MPTTYAHWRFGDKCITTLPDDLRMIVINNRAIFDYGVHGPDIFFYYNCLKHNKINDIGENMHITSYKDILAQFKLNYRKNKDDGDAKLAYILGFTCHFTLDSYCHGYIEIKEEKSGVSHNKLESQFDRYLMKKDGLDPVKKSRTFSLKPDKKMAKDISELFDDISYDVAYKTIRDQKKYLTFLHDKDDFKRFVLVKGMNAFGAKDFVDLLITDKDEPKCADSNLRLDKYFDKAVEHYPLLAKNVYEYLFNDVKLPDYFKHTFSPKEDYRQLPVLSLEDERKYIVKDLQD